MKPNEAFLSHIEDLIRTGAIAQARSELGHREFRRLGRSERFRVATLARRAGLPYLTLRLLSPLVRPSSKQPIKASDEERAEYAATLVRVGAAHEALTLLKGIDPKSLPEADLYTAYVRIIQWDYEAAIPHLENYVKAHLSDYQRAIGQVNLASSYVHERRWAKATSLISELEESTLRLGFSVLYGNTLEKKAELAIQQHQWRFAEQCLKKAESAVGQAGGLDAFFVKKWKTILTLFRDSKAGLGELKRLRKEAYGRGHWETVRECDAYQSIQLKDEALFLRVYFGTRHIKYRERLVKDFPRPVAIPESYDWDFGSPGGRRSVVDLFQNRANLKFGQLKQRLLKAIVSDLYRPIRLPHLFAEVYPDEYFQVNSSPARIHEGVSELKAWLKQERIALQISGKEGDYHILPTKESLSLRLPNPSWWEENSLAGINLIRTKSGGEAFSAHEISRWLDLPRRTAFEWVKEALERKVVTKIGAGPATRYRLTKR